MKLPTWLKDLIADFPPTERQDLTDAFLAFIQQREDRAWEAGFNCADNGITGGDADWSSIQTNSRPDYIQNNLVGWRNSKEYQNDK